MNSDNPIITALTELEKETSAFTKIHRIMTVFEGCVKLQVFVLNGIFAQNQQGNSTKIANSGVIFRKKITRPTLGDWLSWRNQLCGKKFLRLNLSNELKEAMKILSDARNHLAHGGVKPVDQYEKEVVLLQENLKYFLKETDIFWNGRISEDENHVKVFHYKEGTSDHAVIPLYPFVAESNSFYNRTEQFAPDQDFANCSFLDYQNGDSLKVTIPDFNSFFNLNLKLPRNVLQRVSTFAGRERELQHLTENVVKNNLTIIEGSWGLGKSSLISQFAYSWLQETGEYYPVWINLMSVETRLNYTHLWRELYVFLSEKVLGKKAELPPFISERDLAGAVTRCISEIQSNNENPKKPDVGCILCFDGYDEAARLIAGVNEMKPLDCLGGIWPEKVHVVVSSRPGIALDQLRIDLHQKDLRIDSMVLQGMDEREIRTVAINSLGLISAAEHREFVDQLVTNALDSDIGGLPLYIHTVIDSVLKGEINPSQPEKIPNSVDKIFKKQTEACCSAIASEGNSYKDYHAYDFLHLLAVSPVSLDKETIRELLQILNPNEQIRDSMVGPLINRLKFLCSENEGRYKLYHEIYRDFLLRDYPNDISFLKGKLLSNFEQGYEQAHSFGLNYAIQVLLQGYPSKENEKRAAELFCDFEFVMERCRRGDLNALHIDNALIRTVSDAPIIWNEFLTENLSLISQVDEEWSADKIFFQLAIEHADDSPLTIAAEKYLDDGKVDWVWWRKAVRGEKVVVKGIELKLSFVRDLCDLKNGKFAVLKKRSCELIDVQTKICVDMFSVNRDFKLSYVNSTKFALYNDEEIIIYDHMNKYHYTKTLPQKDSYKLHFFGTSVVLIYSFKCRLLCLWNFENNNQINILENDKLDRPPLKISDHHVLFLFKKSFKVLNVANMEWGPTVMADRVFRDCNTKHGVVSFFRENKVFVYSANKMNYYCIENILPLDVSQIISLSETQILIVSPLGTSIYNTSSKEFHFTKSILTDEDNNSRVSFVGVEKLTKKFVVLYPLGIVILKPECKELKITFIPGAFFDGKINEYTGLLLLESLHSLTVFDLKIEKTNTQVITKHYLPKALFLSSNHVFLYSSSHGGELYCLNSLLSSETQDLLIDENTGFIDQTRFWHFSRSKKKIAIKSLQNGKVIENSLFGDRFFERCDSLGTGWVLVGESASFAEVWDLSANRKICELPIICSEIAFLKKEGKFIIYSNSISNVISIWDLEASRLVADFMTDIDRIVSIKFFNNHTLEIKDVFEKASYWSLKDGKELEFYRKNKLVVLNQRYAYKMLPMIIEVWNLKDQKLQCKLSNKLLEKNTEIYLCEDHRVIVAPNELLSDVMTNLWDLSTGDLIDSKMYYHPVFKKLNSNSTLVRSLVDQNLGKYENTDDVLPELIPPERMIRLDKYLYCDIFPKLNTSQGNGLVVLEKAISIGENKFGGRWIINQDCTLMSINVFRDGRLSIRFRGAEPWTSFVRILHMYRGKQRIDENGKVLPDGWDDRLIDEAESSYQAG